MNLALKLLCLPLIALAVGAAVALPAGAAESPVQVGKLLGTPVIGDDNSPLGDVDDVLIGYDGRITDFIVNLTGEKREGQRVRLPFADARLERDPAQVKLATTGESFAPYPAPPHGTLGGIKAALLSSIVGAPAKTRFGERVGEVVSVGARSDGQIVDVAVSQGGGPTPLPWSFVEIRAEKSTFPTEREIEAVVVVTGRE